MSLESVFKLSLIMNMIDNLTGPMTRVQSSVGGSVSKLQGMQQTLGSVTKTGFAMAEVGSQITDAALAPVKATFDTRRALGELTSMGVKDLRSLETAARDFSDTWAGTTKAEFLSAAVDIKGGIDSLNEEGIAKYTEIAGLTAKATGSTIDEMTSLFATGYGIYKDYYSDLSDIDFAEMFSAGMSQAILTFKASGSSMAQSVTALGGAATSANVPLEEQLSVLGMLQATMSGSEAGTKYRAFLRTAAKAGDELGLSFMDANNQLRSMPEILGVMKSKYGETLDAIEKQEIQKAFGSDEAVALIDLMYSKTDALQGNILTMYDSMGQGTEVTKDMAKAINDMEPDQYEIMNQKIQNIKESVGNSMLPTFNQLLAVGERGLTRIGAWVDKNQELVRGIMLIVLVVGGFLSVAGTIIAVVGSVGLVITKTIGAFQMLKSGFLLAKGAILPLISSVWSFTAALLANPITWIVIGIVALIAGLVLLYNKCEWFRNGVNSIIGGIGSGIKSFLGAAKATVSETLDSMKAAYEANGGGIRGIAAAAMEGVKGYYTAGFRFIDNLTGGKLTEIVSKFSQKLGPVKEVIGNVMEAAKATALEKLGNMKAAYEANGGGIRGITAAAMEGVKGYYTAGFTFIDNLTGGKLSGIRDKFIQGIDNIKNSIMNSLGWFRQSGSKIMTTFTEGIKSAVSAPANAVKSGLQKIRNMLPFSDAKTGPLSTLTLSGKRTMSTYATGIQQGGNLPGEAAHGALSRVGTYLNFSSALPSVPDDHRDGGNPVGINATRLPERTIERQSSKEIVTSEKSEREKGVTIGSLTLKVDFATMKELPRLIEFLREVEDYANGNNIDALVTGEG